MSDISLIAPIASFSPVFTTLIAIKTLGEVPAPLKFGGILLVVLGAYFLNASDIKSGILAPFKNLFSHKGVLLFLLSNLLWSITPIFQKKAIFETHPQIPLYASFMGMFFAVFILSPFAFRRVVLSAPKLVKNLKWFGIYGIGSGFAQLAAYTAFALAPVGYVTTILKLSGLFTIILGGAVLKEQRIKERLFGAAVMLAGAALLAI